MESRIETPCGNEEQRNNYQHISLVIFHLAQETDEEFRFLKAHTSVNAALMDLLQYSFTIDKFTL